MNGQGLIVGALGYALAALTFIVLAVLLAVSQEGRRHSWRLILAVLVSVAWASLMVRDALYGLPAIAVYWIDLIRAGAWIALLLWVGRSAISPVLTRFVMAALAVMTLLGTVLSLGLFSQWIRVGAMMSPLGLTLSLLVLVLLEQIYRNSGAGARWSLKFLVLGLGGIYAFDLFMYAEASLLQFLAAGTWQARGYLNALLVPLVLITARRNPHWQLNVFVSRQVTFYTGAILAVGSYAMLMALGGYLVGLLGGSWSVALQTVFVLGAAVALVTLVFSAGIRRRFRVFITKHFYKNRFDYRVEWLRFVKTLGSTGNAAGSAEVNAVAQIFGSPGGVILVADDARCFIPRFASPLAVDSLPWLNDIAADDELARYLVRTGWVIDLQECRRQPERYDNVLLPTWLRDHNEYRLLAPLSLADKTVGLLLLQEPAPPFELDYETRDLLKTVCQHVATHVSHTQSEQRLAENRQFEAHSRLTAFMMHDLKNSVAQLQLMVTNATRHKHDPEFLDDAFSTAGNVADRITRLIQQLSGRSEGQMKQVDIALLSRNAIARCGDYLPAPSFSTDGHCLVRGDPTRVESIIEHVIRNGQDATDGAGSVSVQLRRVGSKAVLEITDTGCGMTPQFLRDRLFRPFDSTKGAKGMGIGAYQVREYARELGGDVEVRSATGQGTTFSIILPTADTVKAP
jgi:putative PEP-CTERM system histidine kinase